MIALSLSAPPCLVPRPHYSARPKRFGSRGPIENVVFPDRSPRIRYRNELTERDWENAVQGLGKAPPSVNVNGSYLRKSIEGIDQRALGHLMIFTQRSIPYRFGLTG